jgi:hypothetical protein
MTKLLTILLIIISLWACNSNSASELSNPFPDTSTISPLINNNPASEQLNPFANASTVAPQIPRKTEKLDPFADYLNGKK